MNKTIVAILATMLGACPGSSLQRHGGSVVYGIESYLKFTEDYLDKASTERNCYFIGSAANNLGDAYQLHNASVFWFGAYENGEWTEKDKAAMDEFANRINRDGKRLGLLLKTLHCSAEDKEDAANYLGKFYSNI